MGKKKILVSACLLGERTRYDGAVLDEVPAALREWAAQGLVVPVCPEMAGGLPVPRAPAEIQPGEESTLADGRFCVRTVDGQDVSAAYFAGAQEALRLAKEHDVV